MPLPWEGLGRRAQGLRQSPQVWGFGVGFVLQRLKSW